MNFKQNFRKLHRGAQIYINLLNAELNPTCHLLALLGAHHILHVSRIRVKNLKSGQATFEKVTLDVWCSPFRDQRDIYIPFTKSLFKSAGITVSHFFSMLPSTLKYLYSVEPVRMHFLVKQPCTNDTVCNADMQHCTQYHLYTAVSRENAFWLVQRNRDTSR